MLKLKSYQLTEKLNNAIYWEQEKTYLSNYNLIIGENASGKSQFFNRLKFLNNIHTKTKETPEIETEAIFNLEFENEEKETISYEAKVLPGQNIIENIKNITKNLTLFSWENKTFYDESKETEQKQLLPSKISVTKLVDDNPNSYPTINQIGNYLSNIKLIRIDRYDPGNIRLGPNLMEPDSQLRNLGAVILNWKKHLPETYQILLNQIKSIFPFVEDFEKAKDQVEGIELLSLKEADISYRIPQIHLSGGLLRVLGIIAFSIYKNPKTKNYPSLIIIDEIDNGLDFERVGQIIEFIKERSDITQYLYSSHSPVTCNFTKPENWRVFNRHQTTVKVTIPTETKETEDLIKTEQISNWDLYKSHISKSRLYRVK